MHDIIPISQIIIGQACCLVQYLLPIKEVGVGLGGGGGQGHWGDKERVSRGWRKRPIGGERAYRGRKGLFGEKGL
jgi:hypothetical protein